jgi:beta-1,4-N-acetylglucosaminyltransferase
LVTVGSTLFPALTDSVLSPSFISLLSSHGIDRLIIQYGRADLPFNTTTKDMAMNPAGHGSTVWKPDGSSSGVAVEVMRFTDDFEGLVASADAIISHAGQSQSSYVGEVLIWSLVEQALDLSSRS